MFQSQDGQINQRAHRLEAVLIGLAWGYLVLLVLCLLLRLAFENRWWWLGFLNSLTPYWFAPLGLVAPIALLLRRRWLAVAATLGAVVFLALCSELWLPRWRGTDADGPPLTVMTYNVLGSNQYWPAVRRSILDSRADVVSLQELNRKISAAIETELATDHPYRILGSQDSVISRYPITLTGYTFPGGIAAPGLGRPVIAGRPVPIWVLRIDYVFHTADLVTLETR